MALVRLFIATSLDGFIAGKNDDLSWLFTEGDYGYTEFFNSIDTTLSGYETYKVTIGFGEPFPNAGKRNYVFTRKTGLSSPYVEFVNEDPALFTQRLKKEQAGDIWLIGGGQINAILLNAGLIDELIVSVHPVWLGEGIPLFAGMKQPANLKFIKSTTFPTGLVQSVYRF